MFSKLRAKGVQSSVKFTASKIIPFLVKIADTTCDQSEFNLIQRFNLEVCSHCHLLIGVPSILSNDNIWGGRFKYANCAGGIASG